MADRYISIRQIADDLYKHPFLQDLSLESIVNYAVEFSRIVGLPQIFSEKVELIHIKDHRGSLPCDYYSVIQVKDRCSLGTFVAASDSFFFSNTGKGILTYKIQGDFIYTSIPEGDIDFAYNAMMVDKDGFPLIPDDSLYKRALELHIKHDQFNVLFDRGKIPANVYENTARQYYASLNTLRSGMSTPTVDEMEVMARMWNRLLPDTHQHQAGFVGLGVEEFRRF